MEVSEEVKKRYLEQVQKCSPAFLLQALEINNQCDLNYKTANNKRLLQELTLMKICSLNAPQANIKKEETIAENIKPTIVAPASDNTPPPITPQSNPVINQNPVNISAPTSKTAQPPATISIKKPIKQEGNVQESLEVLNAPFTQEKLNEIWQEMAKKVNTESIRIAFQARNPVLKDDSRIVFDVENNVLAAQINEVMASLKPYLAKRLNNNQFNFELAVMQREETTYTPYTDEEKVQDMKKRNPALEEFMDNLELRAEN
jgi:DNA polymerase-3 subunit gamma/tau